MITIEEKLNVFTKLVLGNVQLEYEEKYNEINRQNNTIIEDHKKKLLEKKERIIEDYIVKGKNERSKLISQASIERKRQVLSRKQQFIERIVDELYKMAEDFCNSREYEGFMVKILEDILKRFSEEKAIRLFVNDRDLKKFSKLFMKLTEKWSFSQDSIYIASSQEEMVGGLVVYNEDMTLKVDSSINTIIEGHRWQIGQRIYEALQESGDLDG